jgi:hypothetical protein
MAYTIEAIKNAIATLNINNDEFFKVLNEETAKITEARVQKEVEKSKTKRIDDDYFFELSEGDTIEEFFEELADDDNIREFFCCEDEIPDEGLEDVIYVKVGDKFYEVEIACDAEWIGDWSVRANVVGDVSINSFKEIEEYEIVSSDKYSITIKIK